MKKLTLYLLFLFVYYSPSFVQAEIHPHQVAVLYNADIAESRSLAFFYATQRNIPTNNLIGLSMPKSDHISRKSYEKTIHTPLRAAFIRKNWWHHTQSPNKGAPSFSSQIRLLVCMRGVPFGVQQEAFDPEQSATMHPINKSNAASVDSELALLSADTFPIQGAIPNPYFKKNQPFTSLPKLSTYMLVGRIDGPSYAIAQRLITDAIAAENQGLWGMCYIDHALKGGSYQEGDDWMTEIEEQNWAAGIPCVVDKNKQTFLTHYPMRDAILYYGWYTHKANGPLLDDAFRFKRGAVAMHLHSYSAKHLRSKTNGWVGPLLDKGAAATVGNVYEPYLTLTHHFDIFNDRLLSGYTFIESATMSIPVLSWQNVALGDPLYRPFKAFQKTDTTPTKSIYQTVRKIVLSSKKNPKKIAKALRRISYQTENPLYWEILGLYTQFTGDTQKAIGYYLKSETFSTQPSDKIRLALHIANAYRLLKSPTHAIDTLQSQLTTLSGHPAAKSIKSMLNILKPPPPPPAQPREN